MAERDNYYEVISSSEIAESDLVFPDARVPLQELLQSESSFLTSLSACMVGAFVIPDKTDLLKRGQLFVLQLDAEKLVIIDDTGVAAKTLEELRGVFEKRKSSPARTLFIFMRHFIKDDAPFLTDVEKELEQIEEAIIDERNNTIRNHEMLIMRRRIFKLNTYYEQLADALDMLGGDDLDLIADTDQKHFRLFSQQVDRLFARSKSLREYNMQLQELYQMQTDTQLNKTMRVLTVVATVFMPLTLLTGWYGMNFDTMPEVGWEYGYLVVIVIALVLVVVELTYFRKKQWL